MKNSLAIATKLAQKELAHGWKHFGVFLACLVLGVTVMACVNSFGSIVKLTLSSEAQSLLGGDMEVRIRGVEASPEQRQFISNYGDTSYVATLRSMLRVNEQNTLVEIKAIDAYYPLIGTLEFHETIARDKIFAGNGIAVDPILLAQLDLKLGDKVTLGEATYTINATIKREPDKAVQIFSFGPRVMMNHEALAASKLVSTFSLTEHRYRVVTPDTIIPDDNFENKVEGELKENFPETSFRVSTGTDGNRTLKQFIQQLLAFMVLSGLATFLIAGIGIGSSARSYLNRKSHTIAVLKVQGATRKTILQCYIIVIATLALVGGIVGATLAVVITSSLMPLLATVLPTVQGQSGFYPPALILAVWYGILVSFLFSVPALLAAVHVKPSLLFRSKAVMLELLKNRTVFRCIVVIMVLLLETLILTADDFAFMLAAIFVIGVAFVIFTGCSLAMKHIAKKVRVKTPWLKLALGNLHRPGSTTTTVIFAIGISLMVLTALILTEANFQTRIKQLLEEKAPSLFLIDIQSHQKQAINDVLMQYTREGQVLLFPTVRGRITHINGVPVSQVNVDDDVDWAVRGDRALSYSATPPSNAYISKGTWWDEEYQGDPQLSVDARFLPGMGLALGDSLTVNILGEEITATVTSARDIDYSTFQLNFAMIFSPGSLEKFPDTALATVHFDDGQVDEFEVVNHLANEFPNVTVIRTREVILMVQEILRNIGMALRVTVAISIFAGLLVLTSALSATLYMRMYDIAVLKVLGAQRSDILKSCTAEWMMLAGITSLFACGIGTIAAWLINERFRNREFFAMPEVTLVTLISCIIVIWIIGYFGNRKLFNFRPSNLLRNE